MRVQFAVESLSSLRGIRTEELATPAAFRRDPALVWGWYEWRRMLVMRAKPNAAHLAIARLADIVPRLTVVTQNVDDLHERAGNTGVIHLHGSFFAPRCFACSRAHTLSAEVSDEPDHSHRLEPPRCSHCGGPIRPGVVWFGEPLPEDSYRSAKQAIHECDVLFSIGTSAMVYPAAALPFEAVQHGATVIQINPSPTEMDTVATFNLRGPAGVIMEELVSATWPP